MKFTAAQLAGLIGGSVEGDSTAEVSTFAKIEEGHKGALSFLANPKYNSFLYGCESSVVIVSSDLSLEKEVKSTLIRVDNPYESFALLLRKYEELKSKKSGIEEYVSIAESASVGENIFLGSFSKIGANSILGNGSVVHSNVVIGDRVEIGKDCQIFPGVVIYDDCKIGDHCTIHSGTVIGGDGFGFAPNSENNYEKIPQIGNVILEDHVEIGSNCAIDRATMGSTVIRRGVKLDNLVQIAHNVEIGENTVIAAQSGVAGSTKIGKNCMIGGQVGIIGHLEIADGTKIAAQSGIGQNITEPNKIMQGSPAFEIGPYKKSYVGFRKLPEIMRQISAMEKEIESQVKNGK